MLIPHKIQFHLSPKFKPGALAIWVKDDEKDFKGASSVVITGDSRINGTYPIGQMVYSNKDNVLLIYTEEGLFNEKHAEAFKQELAEPVEVVSLQIQPQSSSAPDLGWVDGQKPYFPEDYLPEDVNAGMNVFSRYIGWFLLIAVLLGLFYWNYKGKK